MRGHVPGAARCPGASGAVARLNAAHRVPEHGAGPGGRLRRLCPPRAPGTHARHRGARGRRRAQPRGRGASPGGGRARLHRSGGARHHGPFAVGREHPGRCCRALGRSRSGGGQRGHRRGAPHRQRRPGGDSRHDRRAARGGGAGRDDAHPGHRPHGRFGVLFGRCRHRGHAGRDRLRPRLCAGVHRRGPLRHRARGSYEYRAPRRGAPCDAGAVHETGGLRRACRRRRREGARCPGRRGRSPRPARHARARAASAGHVLRIPKPARRRAHCRERSPQPEGGDP